MKTIGWAMALGLATGCGGALFPVDGSGTGGTDSDTAPTAEGSDGSDGDDGSGDDGPQGCQSDSDCDGYCAWCYDGVCQEDVGCCGAAEEPSLWRCSPPLECWDDSECGPGEICLEWEGCVPDPNAGLRQPPLCRDDFVLSVEEIPLDVPVQHVSVHAGGAMGEGRGLLASDDQRRLWQIDLVTGAATALATLPGSSVVDLQATASGSTVALTRDTSGEGETYQLALVQSVAEAWQVSEGPVTAGTVFAMASLEGEIQSVVAEQERLDYWALLPAPALMGDVPAPFAPSDLVGVRATNDAEQWLALLGAGTVLAIDPASGEPLIESLEVAGEEPIGLGVARDTGDGDGQQLVVVSTRHPDQGEPGEVATLVQVVRDLENPQLDEPFGTLGQGRATVVADVDGDGNDDVLVAMADGRLDLYRMHETDVLCRSFLPIGSEITELSLGDVDGDGALDVIAVGDAPGLTVVHGHGPG